MDIPAQMRHLPLDRRGYPIPVGVLVDQDGQPHFTVNNEGIRQRLIRGHMCGICGKGLLKARWIVGGPMSAFEPHGAYIDPPMHEACAKYALTVCPYLAAPRYTKRIEDRTVKAEKIPGVLIAADPTMIPERPQVFVLGMYVGERYTFNQGFIQYIRPNKPWRKIEYWMLGERLDDEEGRILSGYHV